jgi:hypothetical protein
VALRKAWGEGLQQLFQGLPTFPSRPGGGAKALSRSPFFRIFWLPSFSMEFPMRRFNVMLNGSRLMMFPFYVCILICVALLMVKFAMQLYVCRDIIDIHYLDLITGYSPWWTSCWWPRC